MCLFSPDSELVPPPQEEEVIIMKETEDMPSFDEWKVKLTIWYFDSKPVKNWKSLLKWLKFELGKTILIDLYDILIWILHLNLIFLN